MDAIHMYMDGMDGWMGIFRPTAASSSVPPFLAISILAHQVKGLERKKALALLYCREECRCAMTPGNVS